MKHTAINIATAVIALATSSATASAQTYTKDVDVTVELQPELRAASRIDISPAMLSKSFNGPSLRYSSNSISADVTPMITPLPALAPASIYSPAETNGYLVAGYFPWVNFGASAGYRLVNSRSTRLEAWTQLNRNRYKQPAMPDDDGNVSRARVATTDFDLGLDFAHSARGGVLSAATSLYLSHFNYPLSQLKPSTQNVTRYRLKTGWHSTLDENASGYAIDGDIDYFRFGKASFPRDFDLSGITDPNSLHEISGSIGASGQLMFNDIFGMGLSIRYTAASVNERYMYMSGQDSFHRTGKNTRGVLSLGASFRFNANNFSGHIGPVVDIPTGNNKGGNTFTHAVLGTNGGASGVLNCNLSRYFLVFTTVETGTQLNTLGHLYDINRYAAPLSTANPAYLDCDLKLGISIGPFKGFSMTARGGYADASNWALPVITDGISSFAGTNLSTLYYSVELRYALGTTLSAKAQLEGAISNSVNHSYYRWSDRARQVIDVTLSWRPVDELTIEAGYDLRLGRKICNITTFQEDMDLPLFNQYNTISLGRINCGRIGVSYAFDKYLSIFGRVEGIGQPRYLQAGGTPGQRLRGLIGAAISF